MEAKKVEKMEANLSAPEELVRLLGNRVLVVNDEVPEKTAGGIIIPDTAKNDMKLSKGTIVAVGEGHKDEPMMLKEGERITYGKYTGSEVEMDGRKFLVMRQTDVVCVIK